jgi:hypothetical protein
MLKYVLAAMVVAGPALAADATGVPLYNTSQYCDSITAAVSANDVKGSMGTSKNGDFHRFVRV